MEPIERRAIKPFKLFDIFQKARAMRIQLIANRLHLVLQPFITADHLRGFRTRLVEDPGEKAGLIRKPRDIKAAQSGQQGAKRLPRLSRFAVLGPFQHGIGGSGGAGLRFLPEAQHRRRIGHIKLGCEAFNLSPAFLWGGDDIAHE